MNEKLVAAIKKHLTPDLLKDSEWRTLNRSNRMAGHCYVASEAYYHLSKEPMVPCRIEVRFWYKKYKTDGPVGHWYLRNKKTGEIIDITAAQFVRHPKKECRVPEYEFGKGCGFLTRKPSKRAQVLIERVKHENY